MRFQILGPLEASWENRRITLGGSRQQVVLAMLLLEADRLVSVDQLVDAVWDENPPATARSQIQICVSSLRRAFLPTGSSALISTRKPGYQLEVGDADLDSRLFEARVAEGRRLRAAGEEGQAAAEFRAALDLWRGPALSSVSSRLVQYGATLLNDRHLSAAEEYFDVKLRTGADHELVSELVRLAEQYPLRERFRALLMTALYRSGRQAEALAVYHAARKILIDELGIEPGAELQRLHELVLNGTPIPLAAESTELWPRAGSGAPVPQAAAGDSAARPARRAVPRLLPPTIADFTGRAGMVEQIAAGLVAARDPVAEHAVPITVIYGQGGVGKTTLAVHVAHLLTDQFPDGQLFARLRSGDQAADPADVLRRFLLALGVSDSAMPAHVDERAERFRNLLSDSKMLVVLDDAMSEQQLSYLLPGSARCAVLVTSRRRLTILPAGHRYEVEPLQRQASLALFTRVAGSARPQSEPDAVAELCGLCGDLPLALRIVAARLAARPHWSPGALVERLTDESRRLDELNHGGMGMRASIAMSYDSLSADARRLFRRLALSDAPNFARWIGVPLLGVDTSHAEELFEELTEAYLLDVEQSPPAGLRYRFHDIMRPFARERLLTEDTPQERRQALERMIGALLGLAREAHRREYSGDYLLPVDWAACWPLPEPLVDRLLEIPLAWYENERQSITAAVRQAAASGLVEHSWQLALSAVALFEAHSHLDDWRETHETALRAACRAGDKRGEAAMRYSLGSLHMFEQQNGQAGRQLTQAHNLYRQLGEQHGAALVQRNLAMLDRRQGNLELALGRWEDALDTLLLVGDRIAEAHVLYNMARVRLDYGEEDVALGLLHRATLICEETGNRRVAAQVQHQLGQCYLRAGDLDRAARAFENVLALVVATGDKAGECYAAIGLGTVDLRRGRLEAAAQRLAVALALAVSVHEHVLELRAALALAETELVRGMLAEAAERVDAVIGGAGEIKAMLLTAQALVLRGKIHDAGGEPEAASTAWHRAETLLSGLKLQRRLALSDELALLRSRSGRAGARAARPD